MADLAWVSSTGGKTNLFGSILLLNSIFVLMLLLKYSLTSSLSACLISVILYTTEEAEGAALKSISNLA
jgi:hypothetical protein